MDGGIAAQVAGLLLLLVAHRVAEYVIHKRRHLDRTDSTSSLPTPQYVAACALGMIEYAIERVEVRPNFSLGVFCTRDLYVRLDAIITTGKSFTRLVAHKKRGRTSRSRTGSTRSCGTRGTSGSSHSRSGCRSR